jgi:hypothetical protein
MSDRYKSEYPAYGITFEVDRLRRDHHELIGELTVRCGLPGAQTVNGVLDTSDFNFSSMRARQDRAKVLTQRARTNGDVDFFAMLLDFTKNVFDAERTGDPAIDLRTFPDAEPDEELKIDGLYLPRKHPAIVFGDGGSLKSYIALLIAGHLEKRDFTIGLFDWEMSGQEHRTRLHRLFGTNMPRILYVRCERPLASEVDRLRRIVRDNKIDYAILDSIAPACDGRPEEAEVAGRYFRALRQINCGTLNIAHINKSEDNDRKPFGSSFWHNLARSTWFVQAAEPAADGTRRLLLINRKNNLGPAHEPFSYVVTFNGNQTEFRRSDVADVTEFAAKLSVRQRIAHFLRHGARTHHEIAMNIEADVETVKRTIRRYQNDFVAIDGGRIGLKEKSA